MFSVHFRLTPVRDGLRLKLALEAAFPIAKCLQIKSPENIALSQV
jgi:hypothetical protein